MTDQVRVVFREVADLTPAERQRVYAERGIEASVQAEVESLLGFDSANLGSLTECVSAAAGELLHSAGGRQPLFCGRYRLIQLLGSGGMGAVYLAERNDGEIRQRVAVKLLGSSGQSAARRARFLEERELLASLHHPSIVHVIDAGHTEDGQPYLVMEYVDGEPIDTYAARIGVRERLELFVRVCEAVSHAHRRLIIHRDLKPSNILVDTAGQPKLLDFGIAKLLDETGESTQTVERLLTPGYASPEQMRGAAQTTATDIYSLGAVLYKLLTGRSPQEAVVEATKGEAPRASRLNPQVPVDIDFILRRAMRTEPEERYASAEALAGDIRAFLESRPVAARSGNAWYRTRKSLRRYWAPVTAAALVIASLSAGLYVANRGRAVAERRFRELRNLSSAVFDLDHAISELPGSMQARHRLVAASLQYLEGLAREARGDLDLAREIGEGYWRVGRVQGVPVELNLGEPAKAEVNLKKADEFIETVLAARPNDYSALYRSGVIANDRMILAQEENHDADAVAQARKCVARLDAFLRLGETREEERIDLAGRYGNVALAYLNMHRYGEAIPHARHAVEVAESIPTGRHRVSESLSLLASALRYRGDLDGALDAVQRARMLMDHGEHRNETSRMFDLYGILLRQGLILGEDGGISLNRPADAIEPLEKAFDLTEEAARKDPKDAVSRVRAGNCGTQLAKILCQRDPRRALAVFDVVIQRLGEVPNSRPARRQQAMALAGSSYALRRLRRPGEARQRIDAALAILQETKDYPVVRVKLDSAVYVVLRARADYEDGEGDPQRAVKLYEELLSQVMAAKPDAAGDLRDAIKLSLLYEALAHGYRRTGNSAAGPVETRRLELWRQWDHTLPNNRFVLSQLEVALALTSRGHLLRAAVR